MAVRSGPHEMSEKGHHNAHESSSVGVGLVSSLMKSWRISSSSSSSPKAASDPELSTSRRSSQSNNDNNHRTGAISLMNDQKFADSDGNFDAIAKQKTSTIRTPSASYSPMRYMSPSNTNNVTNESPRTSLLRHNNHHSSTHTLTHTISNTTTGNGREPSSSRHHDRYFKDLDEDWSAVIDDYNMPIPTILNGGVDSPYALSRKSTTSSINTTSVRSTSFNYPQLPHIQKVDSSDLRSEEELDAERNVQELNSMIQRIAKFDDILKNKHIINQQQLREISWNGVPKIHRPVVWKLLIGYLPANTKRQALFLQRKRKEYRDGLDHTFSNQHSRDIPTWHQIEIDIPRTNPQIPLYQFKSVQASLQKILYLWAIRHPTSGYVQGINDLVTPFYQTFLTEYLDQDCLQPQSFPLIMFRFCGPL